MQQSKNLAIAFLLGAVVVGGALGFTADRVMLADRISRPEGGRPSLADRLQLDASQRARLDSLLDDRHRRMNLVMAPVKPTLDSIRSHTRDEIRLILNATQLAEFEKVLAEMDKTNKTRDDDN